MDFFQIFDAMITEFPELDTLLSEFENYALCWETAGAFLKVLPQWLEGPMNLLIAEDVLNNVEQWYRASAKCAKLLTGPAKIVAESLKTQIKGFQVKAYIFCLSNMSWFLIFLNAFIFALSMKMAQLK